MKFRTSGLAMAAAAVVLAGCGEGLKRENEALRTQVEQMAAVSAEKDSLLQIVTDNTQLMNDINTELSRVKDLRSGVMPVASGESAEDAVNTRTYLLARVKEVSDRVNQAETRLAASQRRARQLTGQVSDFERQVGTLQAMIDSQKVMLAGMSDRINQLQDQNVKLVALNEELQTQGQALRDTVDTLVTRQNTVYYVVGTKDQLLERGLVVEEGSRFLFFGSKQLHPARDLPDSLFTEADLRGLSEIPLPDSTRAYKIVSRQNVAALAPVPDNKGRIRGSIQIADPQVFWQPSRYLIVVQQ